MATTFANLPGLGHVKWVLPHASVANLPSKSDEYLLKSVSHRPRMPITFKGGEVVHGWYECL